MKGPCHGVGNLKAFDLYPERLEILKAGDVMPDIVLASYREQTLSQWKTELHDRIIPQTMEFIRGRRRATARTTSPITTSRTGWRSIGSGTRSPRTPSRTSAF